MALKSVILNDLDSIIVFRFKQSSVVGCLIKKGGIMPWYNGDYPPSYKNQPKYLRDKAVEIANEILKESGDEGIAIATGLKKAREYFEEHPQEKDK
jgi:hypothetical protein